ncbi:sialidase family protein [Flavobacterium wongokense]|uniref:sialidase family protein n=1 Tax=Flavobacterium wongokense TaxID=2910674 RepID=UPI001F36A672|nr:oxidoreductase [Flavobacterium sp. WG47]MCF6131862.1 oxidoreductase [Flavobacterium sp. WG47]
MKNIFLALIVFNLFANCKSGSVSENEPFKSVSVDTILNDKISIRAILIDKDKIWYAADKSRMGYYDFKTLTHLQKTIANTDEKLEFRSIAQNTKSIFIANIGNPANVFKVNKSDMSFQKVYMENNEKAFYDAMNFWNEKKGIAIGDPTENCLSVLITRDAGKTWKKTSCLALPKVENGEAAFAASNTNICIKGNKTWVVSGGKRARVFYSPDKGNTWEVFETPIVQGQEMTGIFTANFYNGKLGIIAGGNYEIPELNSRNKAISFDGGKTWGLIAEKSGFGYASCIQYVPKSKGKQLVSVGLTGLYYSSDGGFKWKQLLNDKTLYTIRFLDENTAFAAGKDKIIKIEFKK